MIWRGPLREDDRESQVSEVEGFISRGVSGIALAPLDEAALVGPVEDAMGQKIPVVIFDSGLKGDNYVSFVATDNDKGGQLGGERLIEAMGGKGNVVLLRYAEGHDSTTKREEGFLAAMKANPGVKVVSSNQYVGTDVEEAYKRTESILSGYKKPDGSLSVDGIFCANESSCFAAMRVLKDNGWAGKVHFVGFDASDNLVKGLEDGTIDGLVLQDPVKMGYLAIKTLVAHIKGEQVERRIDTGVHVATPREHEAAGDRRAAAPGTREMTDAPAAAPPRFAMRGIRKAFGATVALDGVDLSVSAGEICGLIGQNGAGKSTLMSILSGAQPPDAGEMSIDGAPFAPASPIDARRAGVAMIYQELSLAPHLSVMENILMGVEPMRFGLVDWPRMRDAAARALAQLGHHDISPTRRSARCRSPRSSSSRSRARSRVGCRVLVLDEPTSSLGRADVERLFALLRTLKAQGHAIVYISHFIEEVKDVADRFIVLRDGRNAGGGATARRRTTTSSR